MIQAKKMRKKRRWEWVKSRIHCVKHGGIRVKHQPTIGRLTKFIKCGLSTSFFLLAQNALAHPTLTLKQVEQIALQSAPALSQSRHNEESLRQAAVAAGQLPDPKLHVGVMSVPVDTFSLTQENMTQVQVGLAQMFPKGQSLSIKSRQKIVLASAEHFGGLNTKAVIRLTVDRLLDLRQLVGLALEMVFL